MHLFEAKGGFVPLTDIDYAFVKLNNRFKPNSDFLKEMAETHDGKYDKDLKKISQLLKNIDTIWAPMKKQNNENYNS